MHGVHFSAGAFIASYLRAQRDGASVLSPEEVAGLRFPMPLLREMQVLAKAGLVVAASDSSDGVLGAVENIARRSECGFEFQLDESMLSPEVRRSAVAYGYNPWNLFFFWGDWSIVIVVRRDRLDEFKRVADENSIPWLRLGQAVAGRPRLEATINGKKADVLPLRNENFVARSFNAGIKDHVTYMLSAQLFAQ